MMIIMNDVTVFTFAHSVEKKFSLSIYYTLKLFNDKLNKHFTKVFLKCLCLLLNVYSYIVCFCDGSSYSIL